MLRPILVATLIAGTLDILSAFFFAGLAGATPVGCCATSPAARSAMRRHRPRLGGLGLLVHFAIMACMAAAYVAIAPRLPALLRHPVIAGLLYGLLLWLIMYWVVKPLRWPDAPLPHSSTPSPTSSSRTASWSASRSPGRARRYFERGTRPA